MSLYNFFQPVQRECLPDPRGPLSRQVPSSATASANSLVTAVLQSPAVQPGCTQSQRGQYAKLTPEQKAEVGNRAAEHGIASTICYCAKWFPLKESSVFCQMAPQRNSLGVANCLPVVCEDFSRENLCFTKSAKLLPHENFPLYGMLECHYNPPA